MTFLQNRIINNIALFLQSPKNDDCFITSIVQLKRYTILNTNVVVLRVTIVTHLTPDPNFGNVSMFYTSPGLNNVKR